MRKKKTKTPSIEEMIGLVWDTVRRLEKDKISLQHANATACGVRTILQAIKIDIQISESKKNISKQLRHESMANPEEGV